jgi:N-formylglutamate deformylase
MVYNFLPPQDTAVPILISVPHCGTAFPDELIDQYNPSLLPFPDDTDWFVERLYDFAPAMGIAMITAHYSRWVIDLNRDPQSKPLYSDGRIITALCPSTTFLGERLYPGKGGEASAEEVKRRLTLYYLPYHQRIQEELRELKNKFGKVLLWDCHSIRQVVPTIQRERFPDLILGDVYGTSASPGLIEIALRNLETSSYLVSHNHPFKGGSITRHFGLPAENRHALQLEMTKINYMDDSETQYDEERAGKVRRVLENTFEKLIEHLC